MKLKLANMLELSLAEFRPTLFILRKRLFAGTPPAFKNLFAGAPPAFKNLFAGTPPAFKILFARTPPAFKNLFAGTLPAKTTHLQALIQLTF
jgi:hypothetical protein